MLRPSVLLLSDVYVPGFRAGGPIRSIHNLVESLGDEFQFHVVTMDRDMGDKAPYPGITRDVWCQVGKGRVLYLSPGRFFTRRLLNAIGSAPYDLIYVNSLFSPRFGILPMWATHAGRLPSKRILCAPRGQLAIPALARKPWRKRIYLQLLRQVGLPNRVLWHATSDAEVQDMRRMFGQQISIVQAPAIPPCVDESPKFIQKSVGTLRIIYIARVHPHKNLRFALECIRQVRGNVTFDIYGPLEEPKYWRDCQQVITRMPASAKVTYYGELPFHQVREILEEHHVFFLPTRSENFGHGIAESLWLGRPVLISDGTRWCGLEAARAGWDIPLANPARFVSTLQHATDMGQSNFDDFVEGARHYAERHASAADALVQNRNLLLFACGPAPFKTAANAI